MNAIEPPFEDPDLAAIAKRALAVLETAIEAGVAGHVQGDEFPLPDDPGALENITAELVGAMPENRRNQLASSVLRAIAERPISRKRELGDVARIDLQSKVSIETQARALPRLRINPRFLHPAGRRPPSRSFRPASPENFNLSIPDAIEEKYQELGGKDGPLGSPSGPAKFEEDNKGRGVEVLYCEDGAVVYGAKSEACAVFGPTYKRYKSDGGIKSRYGVPITDTTESVHGGQVTDFYNGYSLYWSRDTGVHEVHGAIRGRYKKLGGEKSFVGYPTSDELQIHDIPGGRFNRFTGGEMHWHPKHGAHFMSKHILQARNSAKMLAYPSMVPLPLPVQHEGGVQIRGMYRFEGGLIRTQDVTGLVPLGRPTLPLTGVQLVLRQVKILRMPPLESVKAELLVGGSKIDADGDVKYRSAINLGSFKKGQTRNFERVLAEYDLKSSVLAWPASFAFVVGFIEDERLAGSTTDFLEKVADRLRVEVDKLVDEGIQDLETKIDEEFIGPIVGQVLSEIAGWVLDRIWEKLKQGWLDDPCKPVTVSLRVPDPFAFAGDEGKVIETETFETSGVDGIRLRAVCEWRIS